MLYGMFFHYSNSCIGSHSSLFFLTGNTVLQFLNDNWKTVADEFGKPIMDYAVELAVKTIEIFLQAVPYEELINVPIPT